MLWHGEDAKGYEMHSSSCEDTDIFSSLSKSRLDSSSFVGAIQKKGALENSLVPFDTTIDDIFSSMGFHVG